MTDAEALEQLGNMLLHAEGGTLRYENAQTENARSLADEYRKDAKALRKAIAWGESKRSCLSEDEP